MSGRRGVARCRCRAVRKRFMSPPLLRWSTSLTNSNGRKAEAVVQNSVAHDASIKMYDDIRRESPNFEEINNSQGVFRLVGSA